MAGAYNYLKSLYPIVWYTFDRDQTYQLDKDIYFVNYSNYDSPMLNPVDTHIINPNPDITPITPALSVVENLIRYKSFSTGSLLRMVANPYYTGTSKYNPNKLDKYYQSQTFYNDSTKCIISEIETDTHNLLDSSSIYTVLFHIDFRYMRVSANHGALLYREFDVGIYSNEYYITYTPRVYNEHTASMKVMDLYIHIEPINDNSAYLHYSNKDGSLVHKNIYAVNINDLNILSIVVNKNTSEFEIRGSDYNSAVYTYTKLSYDDVSKFQLGYNTKRVSTTRPFDPKNLYVKPLAYNPPLIIPRETDYDEDDIECGIGFECNCEMVLDVNGRTGTFYKMYTTDCELRIDNLAILNFGLSQDQYQKYVAYNYDFITNYRRKGFTTLYDFKYLYDPIGKNYISKDQVLISNSKLNVDNNTLFVRNDSKYDSVYINRNIDSQIEYSIHLSEKSMIYDSNSIYTGKLITTQNFTMGFMFRTLSDNGLLFAYFSNVVYKSNLFFRFVSGVLEIMVDDNIVARKSGLNNNTFYQIMIVNNQSSCNIYLNGVLWVAVGISVFNYGASVVFGNMFPTMDGLVVDIGMISYAPKTVDVKDIYGLYHNNTAYNASGVITLNNIRVGTTILIYNEYTGELIDRLKSDSIDGEFIYYNRYPYTIMVIVNDDTLMNGKSYIVSPVEII